MNYSKIKAVWWSGTCYHKEQLDLILSNTDIKNYAYILHDKDKQPEGGELKKPHYHFLVQLHHQQRGSWFKAFGSDDMGIVFAQPCFAPQGAFDYLIHDTPHAKKQGKYLYAPEERISTIESLDAPDKAEPDENAELYADLCELLEDKITWHEMIKRKPKRIHMIANIKCAHDLLFEERYGVKKSDLCKQSAQGQKPRTVQPPIQPPKPFKGKQLSADLRPLPDDDPLYDIF